jgi:hypothetical protein
LTPTIRGGFANFIAKRQGCCPTWDLDAPPDFRDMTPRPSISPVSGRFGLAIKFQDDSAACRCSATDDIVKQGPTDCIEF